MKSQFRFRVIDVMILVAIGALVVERGMSRPRGPVVERSPFARQVNLDPLDQTAVHADGRLRSFESHATTYIGYVSGPRLIHGQAQGFTYLDLAFRPELYDDVPLIYVKNKLVREQILETLKMDLSVDSDAMQRMQKTGLFSRTALQKPQVSALLQKLGQDLIRTSRAVDAVHSALTISSSSFLVHNLRFIPPPSQDTNRPWLSPLDLSGSSGAPMDHIHAGLSQLRTIPGFDPSLQKEIADSWAGLRNAWRAEDTQSVNAQLEKLAGLLPTVAPDIYPAEGRLAMESWYFRYNSMTWIWLIYLAAVIPLLMSAIYGWDKARTIGMLMFVIAFGFQTASLIIRWYISGRWPNANMFEAVTTAAWFGGAGTLIMEWILRKTPLRNLTALGSAVMSMTALMAAYFLPAHLDPSISNKMAALNDVWLYIHTNVIIWSYAVIGIACIPALLLLRHRWCQLWDSGAMPKVRLLMMPIALAVLNYTGYLLLMHLIDNPNRGLTGGTLIGVSGAFWGSLMLVILEAFEARARRQAGITVDRGAAGGASSIILGNPSATGFLKPDKPTVTQIYDGAIMVLVEVAFIMLWAGTVMGAIWADHSWGRPWGWDPKETFALNTFLIFLVLIHVRLKVKDKAFWTAILAVIGFEVMMFNWIVVNFIISGLHSYA